jgi:hypothetical protein
MSAALIDGRHGVGPFAEEPTVGQLGEQTAEAVRALNHLTRSGTGGLRDPAEVYEVVAALACTAGRLPQLLGQLSQWLFSEQRAGRLRVDDGAPSPDPAVAVAAVIGDLAQASRCAHDAGRALDAAHQHLAHLAAAGGTSDQWDRA